MNLSKLNHLVCKTLAGATLTIMALAQASNASDITCGGKFKHAEVPYAKKPDGCSSWSNNPYQVRDSWGPVSFREACNEHDRCYYTLGTDPDDCNRRFCRHLSRACEKRLGANGWMPASPLIIPCYAIAASYCGAVKAVEDDTHEKAQDMQREWEQCFDEN
jgi:hypothetical protein